MSITSKYQEEDLATSIQYKMWKNVETFIKNHCTEEDKIQMAILKQDPLLTTLTREGRKWTDEAGGLLCRIIMNRAAIEEKETPNHGIEPTFGGPDLSSEPNGPYEALEMFLLQSRLSSRDYSAQVYELLKGCYSALKAMGADFKEYYSECFALMLDVDEKNIDWDAITAFSQKCNDMVKAMNQQILSPREEATKEGSTYETMLNYLQACVSAKTITKNEMATAQALYNQFLGTSKPVALTKLRQWIVKNTPA